MSSEIGCSTSALDFFTPMPRHAELLASKKVTQRPVNSITGADTIVFDIPGGEDFTDPAACNLVVKLKVTNANGSAMATTGAIPNVALSDNVMAALFRSVTLYMNNQRITESNVYQTYENYFTSRYGYSKNAVKVHLKHLLGMTTEVAGKNDSFDGTAKGWTERKKWTEGSKEVCFVSPIPCDFFKTCSQYIPPGQDLRLEFKLNDSEFVLSGAGTCVYKLTSIELETVHVDVVASSTMALFKQRAITPFQLHYSNMQVQSCTIPAKTPVANLRGLFRDKTPSQIYMLLVETDRINGVMAKDPFKFEHANVQKVILRKNGLSVNNLEHITDFEGGDAKVLYDRVIDAFQVGFDGADNNLSYEQFMSGSTMWAWTLAPNNDAKCAVGMSLTKGDFEADIYIKQGKADGNADLTALFLAKFDATVTIGEGNATTNQ